MKFLQISLCIILSSCAWAQDFEGWAEDFEVIAESCGFDPDAMDENISEYFQKLGTECSAQEEETFNNALADFQTCAGFDLKAFIENLPSAAVGTFIECEITADWSNATYWKDPTDFLTNDISKECLNFEYGHNAFGDGFRQIALYPDRVLPCFSDLSNSVSSCYVDFWPIPLVGGWLKPIACIIGKSSDFVDDVMKMEMETWASCLPEDGGCENDCADQGSFYVHPRYGIPVPDAIKRIAGEEEGMYKDALERYESYLSECTETWDGWTGESQSPSTESTKGKYGWLLFVAGLVVGAILLEVVLWAQAKRRNTSVSTEGSEGPKPDASNIYGTTSPVV